jgi:hypothetical protein
MTYLLVPPWAVPDRLRLPARLAADQASAWLDLPPLAIQWVLPARLDPFADWPRVGTPVTGRDDLYGWAASDEPDLLYVSAHSPHLLRTVLHEARHQWQFARGVHPDGVTVSGVVTRPVGHWEPADLLWSPPGAKSGPDRFGEVVDVRQPAAASLWVRAQLDRRRRHLDQLRARVASGDMRLDAVLAKLLGLDGPDAAQLTERRADGDVVAALRAIHESSRRRMLGLSPLDKLLRVDLDAADLFDPIVLN